MVNITASLINLAFAADSTVNSGVAAQTTSTSPAKMIGDIYNISLMIGGILAVGFVIWGGARYIFNAGNPSGTSAAKENIYNALKGLILLLGAYVILYTINPTLTNLSMPDLEKIPAYNGITGGTGGGGVTVTTGTLSPSSITDAKVRGEFSKGISVNHNCPQTCFDGMQQSTIDYINQLQKDCGCNLTVTAGTENIEHTNSGGYSHQNGYKFDLRPGSNIDNYVSSNFSYAGTRSDGAATYTNPSYPGVVFAKESDHWDVLVKR